MTKVTDVLGLRKASRRFFKEFNSKFENPPIPNLRDYPLNAFKDDPGKARKYAKLLEKCFKSGNFDKGPFVAMVKSGEVYSSNTMVKEGPYLIDKSRPRHICSPHGVGYAMLAAV
jgi:hypothetical protein